MSENGFRYRTSQLPKRPTTELLIAIKLVLKLALFENLFCLPLSTGLARNEARVFRYVTCQSLPKILHLSHVLNLIVIGRVNTIASSGWLGSYSSSRSSIITQNALLTTKGMVDIPTGLHSLDNRSSVKPLFDIELCQRSDGRTG